MAKGSRNYVAKNMSKYNTPKVFKDRKKDDKLGYSKGSKETSLEILDNEGKPEGDTDDSTSL